MIMISHAGILYLFNYKAATFFNSESQFFIEHLKRGVGWKVNAIEACVSPACGLRIIGDPSPRSVTVN